MRKRHLLFATTLAFGATLTLSRLLSHTSAPVSAASAAELRVCPSGCAYTRVQDALDAATDGDVIKVAEGTYSDVHQRSSITQVAYIDKSLTIQGGYTTTNGFADPPDPTSYPTVLDALDQGRVVYVASGITVTLEGLWLTGGNSSGMGGGPAPSYADSGGGFYANQATTLISDCVIASNRSPAAGGGYVNGGTVTLLGSVITSNHAISYSGGGIHLQSPTSSALSRSTIISNSAAFYGGGLYIAYGSDDTVVSQNTIAYNTASGRGGGVFMNSDVSLERNELAHNVAGTDGGALFIYRSPIISSNLLYDNEASGFGGGIYVGYDDPRLQANTIISNSAELGGGGINLLDSQSQLVNNIVAGNRIGSGRHGAGIFVWSGAPLLLHTTIAGNSGGDGTGVYLRDFLATPGTAALTNTILVSQSVGIEVTSGNTATIEATLWGSGAWANGTDAVGLVISSTNVTGDPAFIAPDAWDYHIASTSDAKDAGVDAGVTVDVDGQSRPAATGYDVGADEFWWNVYLPLVLRQY